MLYDQKQIYQSSESLLRLVRNAVRLRPDEVVVGWKIATTNERECVTVNTSRIGLLHKHNAQLTVSSRRQGVNGEVKSSVSCQCKVINTHYFLRSRRKFMSANDE